MTPSTSHIPCSSMVILIVTTDYSLQLEDEIIEDQAV
jgi:hypothetical protein